MVVTSVYLKKCKWLWSLLGSVPVSSMCIDITLFIVTECYEVVSFEVLTWRAWRAQVPLISIPTVFTACPLSCSCSLPDLPHYVDLVTVSCTLSTMLSCFTVFVLFRNATPTVKRALKCRQYVPLEAVVNSCQIVWCYNPENCTIHEEFHLLECNAM